MLILMCVEIWKLRWTRCEYVVWLMDYICTKQISPRFVYYIKCSWFLDKGWYISPYHGRWVVPSNFDLLVVYSNSHHLFIVCQHRRGRYAWSCKVFTNGTISQHSHKEWSTCSWDMARYLLEWASWSGWLGWRTYTPYNYHFAGKIVILFIYEDVHNWNIGSYYISLWNRNHLLLPRGS